MNNPKNTNKSSKSMVNVSGHRFKRLCTNAGLTTSAHTIFFEDHMLNFGKFWQK